MSDDQPIDAYDPRFGRPPEETTPRPRTLVGSRGPGASPEDPKVRLLRLAIPALALLGLATIGAVFYSGLRTSGTSMVLGPVDDVRAQVVDRPLRVCLNDNNPCAWITDVDGQLLAFNTNGPLAEEYGRLGVAWCPSSGWFGANSTGSRWDQRGQLAEGPSPRSLDRFTLAERPNGSLEIDFASLSAGRPGWQVEEVTPPDGPHCDTIPFERAPDLVITRPAGSD